VLALFVWAETRTQEPIIPVEFFRVPIFAATNVIGLLLSVGMFGTLLFLPLYVQGVLALSAQNSGAILTPMMGGFIVSAIVAGQLMTRTGKYKIMSIVAAVIAVVGLYLFTRLGADSSWPTVVVYMVVLGLGIGALLPVMSVVVQNAFPYKALGVVNAAQQFVRSLGAVIATPILGTVLANTFSAQIAQDLPPALQQAMANLPAAQRQILSDPQGLTNAQTQAAIKSQFAAFGPQGDQLYNQFIAAVHQALAAGMDRVFIIAFAVGLAMLLVTIFLPEIPLQREEFFEGEEDPTQ
jgi:MFS family permease